MKFFFQRSLKTFGAHLLSFAVIVGDFFPFVSFLKTTTVFVFLLLFSLEKKRGRGEGREKDREGERGRQTDR